MELMELRFPLPSRAVSINEVAGKHWAVKRRALEPWRTAVGWAWKMAPASERARVQGLRCKVRMLIPFDVSDAQWTKNRRDPHNYVGTVVKSCVDQLVEQGVWPDDTTEWVTVDEPVLMQGNEVVIELWPWPA